MLPDVTLTVDEIVSFINRSSLPTAIIEGDDDVIVYRHLEVIFSNYGLSILPVGGRETLLCVFERRAELPNSIPIIFIADRDTWVYGDVPPEFVSQDLIFTDGYSIENDCFRDGRLDRLMTSAESVLFSDELGRTIEWYALALKRFLDGNETKLDIHPNALLDNEGNFAEQTTLVNHESYPDELRSLVQSNYTKYLRGKTLLALLMRQLSYAGRPVRHHHRALLDVTATDSGPLLSLIFRSVGESLARFDGR
ncbi:MAG: hypothetical protein Q7J32_12665 [Sphingomonadaceae bacterium]|nr:hypothetical protein [Sphingomonadaceae bacterium]